MGNASMNYYIKQISPCDHLVLAHFGEEIIEPVMAWGLVKYADGSTRVEALVLDEETGTMEIASQFSNFSGCLNLLAKHFSDEYDEDEDEDEDFFGEDFDEDFDPEY